MPSRKGSPNRNKSFLLNRLQDMYGDDFHPIIKIAENCVALQEEADNLEDIDKKHIALKSANAEWSRIAEFTEPKLKATELTGPEGGPVQIEEIRRSIVDPENTE